MGCQVPETHHPPEFGPVTRAATCPCVAFGEEQTAPNWFHPPKTAPPEPAISKLGFTRMHWPNEVPAKIPETRKKSGKARKKSIGVLRSEEALAGFLWGSRAA
jgi:hypothetical protein